MLTFDFDRGLLLLDRQLNCDAEQAWEILTTVSEWPNWGPFVSDVEYSHDRIMENTDGRIRLIGGFWIPFQIDTVTDRYWSWSIWGMTPPSVGHGVDTVGEQSSRVTFELPLWAFWYTPVCYHALTNISELVDRAVQK